MCRTQKVQRGCSGLGPQRRWEFAWRKSLGECSWDGHLEMEEKDREGKEVGAGCSSKGAGLCLRQGFSWRAALYDMGQQLRMLSQQLARQLGAGGGPAVGKGVLGGRAHHRLRALTTSQCSEGQSASTHTTQERCVLETLATDVHGPERSALT